MAFSGHTDSDGNVIWRDEIYTGLARVSSLSTPVVQSEPSKMSPRLWDHFNMQGPSNLYEEHMESSSSSTPLSLPPALESNYVKCKRNAESLYCWNEMYGSIKQVESLSSVVPSLKLSSKSNTLDYLRELDGLKLTREPQVAFESWLASKQLLHQQRLQHRREQLEKKRDDEEKQKKLAKLCYEKWLRDKARQESQQRLQNHLVLSRQTAARTASSRSTMSSNCSSNNNNSNNKHNNDNHNKNKNNGKIKSNVRNVSQSEIRQVVQSWWIKKQEQQQRQRQEKQRHLQKKIKEDQRRKKRAEQAWQKWMVTVHEKPKPVPMNQGISSLRGTISPLYVNPQPWKHVKTADKQ
ncbi:hypothetical protein KR222_003880 [Zaprionus bogoriensis]|nr:hypothetical protein KR222_003880 [Zaprionus bogoriensis]